MTTPKIYRATLENEEKAKQIVDEYCEELDIIVRDTPQGFLSYFTQESGLWLGEIDGKVAGCVILRPLSVPDKIPSEGRRIGEVKRLFVAPAYRKSGLAVLLMEALESFAAAQDYEWLYLDTKDDLLTAIRLYGRLGYEKCKRYNENPQATIFMRKRIL